MFRPAARIATSFAIVVAAYAAYALLAVPLIEPQFAVERGQRIVDPGVPGNPVEEQRKMLRAWFSEADWELTAPMVLETDRGILLVRKYRTLGEGRVELKPCTMVFLPQGDYENDGDRNRRAIVMRSPEGAILQFEDGANPQQGRIGKPVGGRLLGPVSIFSQQKSPGPEDDLVMETRDVELARNRIMTPHWIDFRLGPHHGRGRQLLAHLSETEAESGGFGGLTRLELMHDVEVRLQPGDSEIFPGRGGDEQSPSQEKGPQPPVDIRCQGPFQFDAIRNVATFEENVDVQRVYPDRPADQITADLLSIYFNEVASVESSARSGSPAKLEPVRIEARGQPVVIRAPSNQLQGRGEQLEYDVKSGSGTLRGREPVVLRQGEREIRAPELVFKPDRDGRYGTFLAIGQGWLKGTSPDDDSQQFSASWTKQLHFRPYEGNHVLSLEGDAHVESVGRGTLDGQEIHLWLIERPKAGAPQPVVGAAQQKPETELVPDRMLATGQVKINSPQLTGAVEQLEAWFEIIPEPAPPAAAPQRAAAAPSHSSSAGPSVQSVSATSAVGPYAPGPVNASGVFDLPAPRQQAAPAEEPVARLPEVPQQKFDVNGHLLRVRTITRGEQTQIAEAVIERNVTLREISSDPAAGKPLLVTGDQVHVEQPQPEQTLLSVVGGPAYVEARGMTLSGDKIRLDRARNVLWTEGAGIMTLPVDRDLNGKPLENPQPLEIVWAGGMQFDGQVAHFERDVAARMEFQRLNTQVLDATFQERVRFDNDPARAKPQVHSVACRGGVFLESRTFEMRQLKSIDRMEALDLTIEQASGNVSASGPGWIASVRHGTPELMGPMAGAPAVANRGVPPPAAPGMEEDPELTYLNVRFQRGMQGNIHQRQMVFDNQVQTLYGPVATWDSMLNPDRPEQWGPEGLLIHCDRMQVTEFSSTAATQNSYELEATGNTVVEGQTFTARAARLTYAQSKDLLVLEGDGRSDAQLFRQMRVGAPTSTASARKILYWPSTRRADVDGAQFIDLNDVPGMENRK